MTTRRVDFWPGSWSLVSDGRSGSAIPWELIPSEQSVLERKVEADLLGFTRYALAIGC